MIELAGSAATWLRRLRPEPAAGVRLVCFPHAGGAASFFHPLSGLIGTGVEVLAVQYPGRQDRRAEPQVRDIHRLADDIRAVLEPLTGAPYAFFGHSMGAIVAFEVAQRLAADGMPGPLVLFASGRRAPSRHRHEEVHLLDDSGLVAEIASLSGTDTRLLGDPEVLAMVLPSVRADYHAIETYRWSATRPALHVPIVALVGERDPRVTLEEAAAWRDHTTGPFAVHTFPGGGHFYLSQFPHQTARHIAAGLTEHQP